MAVLATACAPSGAADGAEDAVGVGTTTISPAATPTPSGSAEPGSLDPTGEVAGYEVAASLSHESTGIVGAIALGLHEGSLDDPYASLQRIDDGLTIDEEWIEEVNEASRVVEGIDLSGRLLVTVPDVTVRFCRITGDNLYLVDNRREGDGSGFSLEWCELVNERVEGSKTVYGSGMRLFRVEIIGGDDGIVVSTAHDPAPTVIEEVYSHSLRKGPGAHADNIQLAPGVQAPVTIARSKLVNFYQSSNAPVFVEFAHDVTITENYLYGGVYHVMASSDDGGTLSVIDNAMAYDTFKFGLWSLKGDNETIDGNVWWDHAELDDGTLIEVED